MPIFELVAGALIPFRRQAIDSGLYESEIEALLWDNLEDVTGDNLFRVARQAAGHRVAVQTSWPSIRQVGLW